MMKARSGVSRRVEYIAVLAVFVLIILSAIGAQSFVRNLYSSIRAPYDDSAEYAGLSRDALIARIKNLEAEKRARGFESALISNLMDENRELKRNLGARIEEGGIAGRVISRPPQTVFDTLLINIGSREGVEVHDLVTYSSAYLGTVTEVSENTALVELASTPGAKNDVILGEPRAVTIANGMGGGAYELTVSKDVRVNIQDPVLLAENESLIMGLVRHIEADPASTVQRVYFSSPVSFSDLTYVNVVSHTRPWSDSLR